MALQNAYQQFQNGAPPQPNPMFGQQPVGNLQGAPLGGGMAPPQPNPLYGQQPMTQQQHQQLFGPQPLDNLQGAPLGGGTALPQTPGYMQHPQPVFNPSTQQAAQNAYEQDFARPQQMGGGMQPQGLLPQYPQPVFNPSTRQAGFYGTSRVDEPFFNPSTRQVEFNHAYDAPMIHRAGGVPQQAQSTARQQDFVRQQLMGMPMAPATQQTRPEDPRMAAMRNMQRMKLGGG